MAFDFQQNIRDTVPSSVIQEQKDRYNKNTKFKLSNCKQYNNLEKNNNYTILFNNKKLVSYIAVAGGNGEINAEIKFSPSYTNNTGSSITFDEVSLNSSPFYNAENNPLIGRISTRPSNFTNPVDNLAPNIGEPVDFNDSSASNDDTYFPLNLAIYETKPEFSNLEIGRAHV